MQRRGFAEIAEVVAIATQLFGVHSQTLHASIAGGDILGVVMFDEADVAGVAVTVEITSAAATAGHSWHVHAETVSDTSDCSTAGGHYDPEGLEVGGYACDPASAAATCYLGDMSGKFGSATVGISATFTDATLTIAELVGKSVVVHGADGAAPRVGCGTIVAGAATTRPKHAAFGIGDAIADYCGNIIFSDAGDDGVGIDLDLRGDATAGHGWHIHADSLPDSSDCQTAGGHYDPTNVEGDDYNCNSIAPESCYRGDLAGKFGGATIGARASFTDLTLTLAELTSRSFVLHAADGGAPRVGCGAIVAGLPSAPMSVHASLAGGDVAGVVMFEEACSGGVTVTVEITSAAATAGHSWHVHAETVSDTSDCSTA
eukprot:SAG11_NODE_6111_length_1386_cov_5.858586_1_plen_372_part_01